MIHFSNTDLDKMERFYRANLVNSITGYKPANLLATRSKDGVDNVALFSSVTHLGSNPALFSFIQRPLGHGAGHTYNNLKKTGHLSLNHVNARLLHKAHQSSAKYLESISEFDELDIESQERPGIPVPFVKEAAIQIAARYENEYYIKENNCIIVICKITDIFLPENSILNDGWVNLQQAESLCINGLDAYGTVSIKERLSYAQPNKELNKLPIHLP